MTADSNHYPQPSEPGAGQTDKRAAPRDDSPRVAAAVPITVWRLDDRDDELGAGFASRLARRLVDIYTDPHDTVVDFDGDPHLHDAAHATARTYRHITGPTDLTEVDDLRSGVTLAVWRWPRPSTWPAQATTLFTACHLIMARDGCVIVALRSADPGQPRAAHAEHLARLLPPAENAGFRHVLQIVVVGGNGTGDQFVYYATSDEAEQAADDPTASPHVCHIDLLAFTPTARHE